MSATSTVENSTRSSTPSAVWPDVSLFSVAVIWGVNIPIMKNGLDHLDLYVFNAFRLAVSATVLAAFAVRARWRGSVPGPGIRWRHVATYAVLVGAVYQVLFLFGISRTTSGNTALIIATVPMWTALLARLFLREQLRWLAWSGLAVALVGTIIVALQKGDVAVGTEHLIGNMFVLASALVWSAGTVYSRPLLRDLSPMRLAASAAVTGIPVHLILAVGRYQESFAELKSVGLWMIILYSGVLSAGLAQPMWHYGVRHAGAAHAAIIQNLIPLVAIVSAWLTRGEVITVPQMIGGVLILGGLLAMRSGR
ncbi:MAG: DMT family transporter [Planctomycetales bacterium]|nr:DMT family transporter [Planctomycetales bacterium]